MMRTLTVAGLAAVLTSSAALASGQPTHHQDPRRPTISIVGVRGVSTGATDVNIGQRADYNAASAVVISPRASVGVDQAGRINATNVVVIGNRSEVGVRQDGIRNATSVTARPLPSIFSGRR
jgi:hypothetical protein